MSRFVLPDRVVISSTSGHSKVHLADPLNLGRTLCGQPIKQPWYRPGVQGDLTCGACRAPQSRIAMEMLREQAAAMREAGESAFRKEVSRP